VVLQAGGQRGSLVLCMHVMCVCVRLSDLRDNCLLRFVHLHMIRFWNLCHVDVKIAKNNVLLCSCIPIKL